MSHLTLQPRFARLALECEDLVVAAVVAGGGKKQEKRSPS